MLPRSNSHLFCDAANRTEHPSVFMSPAVHDTSILRLTLTKSAVSRQTFRKVPNIKFTKISSMEALLTCGQTDRLDEANRRFSLLKGMRLKIYLLMLLTEITAVYSDSHSIYINTVCGKMHHFFSCSTLRYIH